jgi:hypothetical protein
VFSCSLARFIKDRQLWEDEDTLINILLQDKAFLPVLNNYIRAHAVSFCLVAASPKLVTTYLPYPSQFNVI